MADFQNLKYGINHIHPNRHTVQMQVREKYTRRGAGKILLLQILTPTTFNSLLCQKGNVIEDGLLGKYSVITQKKSKLKFFIDISACPKRMFSGNCLSKRLTGWVLAKSLILVAYTLQYRNIYDTSELS